MVSALLQDERRRRSELTEELQRIERHAHRVEDEVRWARAENDRLMEDHAVRPAMSRCAKSESDLLVEGLSELRAEVRNLRADGREVRALAAQREFELRSLLARSVAEEHAEARIARRLRDAAAQKAAVTRRELDTAAREVTAARSEHSHSMALPIAVRPPQGGSLHSPRGGTMPLAVAMVAPGPAVPVATAPPAPLFSWCAATGVAAGAAQLAAHPAGALSAWQVASTLEATATSDVEAELRAAVQHTETGAERVERDRAERAERDREAGAALPVQETLALPVLPPAPVFPQGRGVLNARSRYGRSGGIAVGLSRVLELSHGGFGAFPELRQSI